MEAYQKDFVEFCLTYEVLRFGDFTLKSGRLSPYFFNAGLFNTGKSLETLGAYYARALHDSKIEFDVLFGPAYKGIPLVTTTAVALSKLYNITAPFAYDRKEIKTHGEGGLLVGAPLQGQRVVIVDDVISAGTAIRRSIDILTEAGAIFAGVLIAMDRQEVGQRSLSAIQEIETTYQVPVCSIISLADLMSYLALDPKNSEHLKAMHLYQEHYGI